MPLKEGGAAGAATLGAAAGAAAPKSAAEPGGDRAPERVANLDSQDLVPGGAERADGVAAREGRAAGAAMLGAAATDTGEVLPDFDDVSSGNLVLSAEKRTLMVEGVQSSGRTALLLSAKLRALMVGAWMARGRCVEGVARGLRGGAWRARRGGRNRREERDGRGGGGALARHA